MSKKKTFVLNDETKINSYGFRVLNSGIDLARFEANPVMLDQHWNSTRNVIGNWENVRIEGSQLLASANFDTEDPDAKKIEGKVNRGFLKGASIGISYNYDFMQRNPDNTYVLTACELFEASIVAIPSNSNAVTLFAETGTPLSANELNEVKLSISKQDFNPNNNRMSKVNLSALAIVALAAAGVTAPDDEANISKGIEQLNAMLTTANQQIATLTADKENLETTVKAQVEKDAKAMLLNAKLEGRITEKEEADLLPQAIANLSLVSTFVAKMPATKKLGGIIHNPSGNADDPKTIDDFEKLPLAKQLAFKTENPEVYAALFA